MDCGTPGFPVLHYLPEFAQMSIESVMPSNHLFLCHSLSLLPSIFPSIRIFSDESTFASGGQIIRASAATSVLPMTIQGWCPLGWTGLISLLSKGLSTSSSAPQFGSINSLAFSLLYGPILTAIHQFSSVIQWCPTLCVPMDFSTPGLPVHHQLSELAQIHVHRVGDAI